MISINRMGIRVGETLASSVYSAEVIEHFFDQLTKFSLEEGVFEDNRCLPRKPLLHDIENCQKPWEIDKFRALKATEEHCHHGNSSLYPHLLENKVA